MVRECDVVVLLGGHSGKLTMLLSRVGSKASHPLGFIFEEEESKILSPRPRYQKSALSAHGYVPKATQISLWQNPNSVPGRIRLFVTQSLLTFSAFPLTTHRWHSSPAKSHPAFWPYVYTVLSARDILVCPPCLTKSTHLSFSALSQLHWVLLCTHGALHFSHHRSYSTIIYGLPSLS